MPTSPVGWHCAGDTPAGTLHLWLSDEADAPADASEGVRQVRALARAEALISAVEQWLCMPWDPVPVQASAAGTSQPAWPSAAAHASVRDPALAPPGTRLALPPQLLRTALPQALRAPRLAWDSVTAQVLLDELMPETLAAMEPGALLWLPASLGSAAAGGWPMQLRDTAGLWPDCPARLDLHAQRLHIAPGEGARMGEAAHELQAQDGASPADHGMQGTLGAGTAPGPARVVLSTPVHIPLDHWLGMGPAQTPFHWPVPQPWLAELRAMLGDDQQQSQQLGPVLAQGTLMRLGQGCGLRLPGGDMAPVAAMGGDALSAPAADWQGQGEREGMDSPHGPEERSGWDESDRDAPDGSELGATVEAGDGLQDEFDAEPVPEVTDEVADEAVDEVADEWLEESADQALDESVDEPIDDLSDEDPATQTP